MRSRGWILLPLLLIGLWLARAFLLVEKARHDGVQGMGLATGATDAASSEALLAPSLPPQAERTSLPALETDVVRVRVRTRASYASDAAAVGGIAFELFNPSGDPPLPPPGNLWPPLALGPDDECIARGQTDTDGEAQLELPRRLITAAQAGLRLAGRVCEPGHQASSSERLFPPESSELALMLVARRGATARGVVVDETGAPLVAEVRLLSDGGRTIGTPARLLSAGAFELEFDEPIQDAVLLADAGVHGTGSLGAPEGMSWPLAAPPQDLRIVVRGPGALRGRLVDDDGRPAPGVALVALAAQLDDEKGTSVLPEPLHGRLRLQGGGALFRMTQSDAAGAFELRGLRDTPFVLRARTGSESGFPVRLTPAPVAPDGRELVLRLARPHLVVQLQDANGQPWERPGVEVVRAASVLSGPPSAWPAEPQVFVHACTLEPDGARPSGEYVPGRSVRPGEFVFEVRDEACYLVGARGGGFDGSAREVEVPVGASGVPVVLHAAPPGATGTVLLSATSGGIPLEPLEFELGIEAVPHGLVLVAVEPYSQVREARFELPPGRYRAFAEGAARTDFQHGILWKQRELGRVEQEFTLAAGATALVMLELTAGARLELSLTGNASPADADAVVADAPWSSSPENADWLRRKARSATIQLSSPGRRPEPVCFSASAMQGTSAEGLHLLDEWALGATQVSEVLPAGRYTLVARLPGGRELRRELELLPGVTQPVTLDFGGD